MDSMENNIVNIPEPTVAEEPANALNTNNVEINAETILAEISTVNEDGHSPCMITASLERINKIVPDKLYMDYTDDEKEFIDRVDINDCAIDIYTLDGLTFNAVLTFDTRESQYLKDLNDICNRYRHVTEEYAAKEVQDKGIVLSLLIAPLKFMGKGICVMNMPAMYCRCLDDNGENTSMFMQFHAGDVDFFAVEMTEEEEIQLTADAMRQVSEGTNGQIF